MIASSCLPGSERDPEKILLVIGQIIRAEIIGNTERVHIMILCKPQRFSIFCRLISKYRLHFSKCGQLPVKGLFSLHGPLRDHIFQVTIKCQLLCPVRVNYLVRFFNETRLKSYRFLRFTYSQLRTTLISQKQTPLFLFPNYRFDFKPCIFCN